MRKELSKIDNFHRAPREGYRNYFFSLTHSEMSAILVRTFLMSSKDDRKLHVANLSGSVVDIYGSITWKFDSFDWDNLRDLILKERKTTEYIKNQWACDVSIIDSAYGYEIRVDIPINSDGSIIPGGLFVDCWNGESEERVTNEDTDEDMVNSPKHYKNGGIETIDLIEMYLSPEEFIGYLKGTILKYRERAPYKGAMNTDYEKAYKFWTWLLKKKTGDGIL